MIALNTGPAAPEFAATYELALHLAAAEAALRIYTGDKVDAIVDASGTPYLLRPAQEQLLQNERWLDSVLDSSADVITVVNRDGAILSQTRTVNRVLGYEQDELIGASIFERIRDEDLPLVHSAFFNVVEGIQEHATAQFNHRARDGSYRMVEATLGKLREAEAACVVFSLRPISHPAREGVEFEKREAETMQTSLPKDRFLAMLAHELRTPLMPVLLCIGELQEDESFAQARPILAMMRRNIELQTRLLEELSDFTTVGQHKVRLRPEAIDVHVALQFVLEICRAELAAARMEVELDLAAPNHIVVADSLRLQQVMWNLVRNAIKFSPQGSKICISSANEKPGTVTLNFVDNGIGIEPELLPLVFDPFQQGERVINRKQAAGLGLGMFIAKGLTEAQDGSLTVSSEGRGRGTNFQLTLKLAPTAIASLGTYPLFDLPPPEVPDQLQD
jgi:PAS domain S-box-containing protein